MRCIEYPVTQLKDYRYLWDKNNSDHLECADWSPCFSFRQ